MLVTTSVDRGHGGGTLYCGGSIHRRILGRGDARGDSRTGGRNDLGGRGNVLADYLGRRRIKWATAICWAKPRISNITSPGDGTPYRDKSLIPQVPAQTAALCRVCLGGVGGARAESHAQSHLCRRLQFPSYSSNVSAIHFQSSAYFRITRGWIFA